MKQMHGLLLLQAFDSAYLQQTKLYRSPNKKGGSIIFAKNFRCIDDKLSIIYSCSFNA